MYLHVPIICILSYIHAYMFDKMSEYIYASIKYICMCKSDSHTCFLYLLLYPSEGLSHTFTEFAARGNGEEVELVKRGFLFDLLFGVYQVLTTSLFVIMKVVCISRFISRG